MSNETKRPEESWTPVRIALWLFVAVAVGFWQWPNWKEVMRPRPLINADGDLVRIFGDFSQEWLSGKNFWSGRPVYMPMPDAFLLHTGAKSERHLLYWNGHPPVCVLLTLPFARFEYEEAHFYWNVAMLGCLAVSLAIVLRIRQASFRIFDLLWLVPLLAVCFPLRDHFRQGQISLLLTLLVVLSWAADRRGLEAAAGASLGMAAAIKLFPAFMLIYWLARGRWRAVLGAAAAFMAANAAALAVLGSESYRTYVEVVLPELGAWAAEWWNLSLPSYWKKLFDPANNSRRVTSTIALLPAPWLAQALALASQAAITLIVFQICRKARTQPQRDYAFGLAIIGMFLVSPITWSHYLAMLIVPLTVSRVGVLGAGALAIYQIAFALLFVPRLVYTALLAEGERLPEATPLQIATILSIQTYSLLIIFYLFWRSRPRTDEEPARRTTGLGSATIESDRPTAQLIPVDTN